MKVDGTHNSELLPIVFATRLTGWLAALRYIPYHTHRHTPNWKNHKHSNAKKHIHQITQERASEREMRETEKAQRAKSLQTKNTHTYTHAHTTKWNISSTKLCSQYSAARRGMAWRGVARYDTFRRNYAFSSVLCVCFYLCIYFFLHLPLFLLLLLLSLFFIGFAILHAIKYNTDTLVN